MPAVSELARQVVHIGVGGLAVLLPLLTFPQAVAAAVAGVVFNLVLLPRLGLPIFRPGDRNALLRSGLLLYPLAVLALVLAFPRRPDIAAIGWVILAAGDGFATLVGAHVRSARLPWNPDKSWAGLIAFVVCAGAAGVAIAAWCQHVTPRAPAWWVVVAPIAGAVVAGLVETVRIRLDDNVSVAVTAALVLWSLSLVDAPTYAAAWPAVASRLLPASLLNLAVAAAGWRLGTVTVPGATVGWAIGVAVFAGAGAAAWGVLIAGFGLAVAATRAGHRRKAGLGIAEARSGRRGPGNAIANTGIAAGIATLMPGLPSADWAAVAMVAALVTGASDTVASEIGKAWGRTTWLVVGFRRVPPGTSGAASLEGTASGMVSAALLGALAASSGAMPATLAAVGIVTGAATVAAFAESVLGATLEASGIVNNDALNLINTALGAGLAGLAWRVL